MPEKDDYLYFVVLNHNKNPDVYDLAEVYQH